MTKIRRKAAGTMERRPLKICNPYNKKVLLEPFNMMIYTDKEGVQRYFDVIKMIKVTSNLELNYVVSQMTGDDIDEQKLRHFSIRHMMINEEKKKQKKRKTEDWRPNIFYRSKGNSSNGIFNFVLSKFNML